MNRKWRVSAAILFRIVGKLKAARSLHCLSLKPREYAWTAYTVTHELCTHETERTTTSPSLTARYNKRTANWPRSSACTNWLNVNIVGHFARNRDCPGVFVIKTNTGHPISIFRAAKQIEPLHPFEIPAQLHSLRGQPFATGSRLHYVERERGEEGRERNKIR